jgi:hypothetical protein
MGVIKDLLSNLNQVGVLSLDITVLILCLIGWLKFREPILIAGFGIYLFSTIVWHIYH